jgi:pyruvate/2-oxoglutarate dehydrogenase complex dihydrolipoamide acyltransferase (E2) component
VRVQTKVEQQQSRFEVSAVQLQKNRLASSFHTSRVKRKQVSSMSSKSKSAVALVETKRGGVSSAPAPLIVGKELASLDAADKSSSQDSGFTAPILNPDVSFGDIRDALNAHWVGLQKYRFKLPHSDVRLSIALSQEHKQLLRVTWVLFATVGKRKKHNRIFARFDQILMPFVKVDPADARAHVLELRPVSYGVTAVQDVINSFRDKGIVIDHLDSLLPPPKPEVPAVVAAPSVAEAKAAPAVDEALLAEEEAAKKAAADIAAAEAKRVADKEAAEAAAVAAAEAARLAEIEAAARAPLPFEELPAFIVGGVGSGGSSSWGGITEEDLQQGDTVDDGSIIVEVDEEEEEVKETKKEPVAVAAADPVVVEVPVPILPAQPVKPAEPTKEELNARGKEEFARSGLHERTFGLVEIVSRSLQAFVASHVPISAKSSATKLQHDNTLYFVTDLQDQFEQDFSQVLKNNKQISLVIAPIVRTIEPVSRPHQLVVHPAVTYDFVDIISPESFAFAITLSGDKNGKFGVTSCCFANTESNKTQSILDIAHQAILEDLQQGGYLAPAPASAPVAAAPAPPASSSAAAPVRSSVPFVLASDLKSTGSTASGKGAGAARRLFA